MEETAGGLFIPFDYSSEINKAGENQRNRINNNSSSVIHKQDFAWLLIKGIRIKNGVTVVRKRSDGEGFNDITNITTAHIDNASITAM